VKPSLRRNLGPSQGPPAAGRLATAGLVACGLALLGSVPVAGAGKCPNLAILLDQSASMAQDPTGVVQPPGSPKSKWAIATAALTKVDNRFDGLLPIGYSNFPSQNNACMSQGLRIPVGYGNRIAINNAMIDFPFSGGSTPICDAITKLAAEPLLKDQSRGQFILLVTDGAPAAACCGANPVQATVDAIAAALQQTPPIYTFVVGFGQLAAAEQQAMNQMALAGGFPDNSDPNYKYYRAETPADLDSALTRILMHINGGDAGPLITCEDGCYGSPCAGGQTCLQNACKPNPCAGKTCPDDQSCQPDGTCAAVCPVVCPIGAACHRGRCVADPCSGTCLAGQLCDGSTSTCVNDPKCQGIICHTSQGCFAGACVDNPCAYLTCPTGFQCRDFDGSCQKPGPPGSETMASGGCEVTPAARHSCAAAALLASALMLLALGRRRRRTFN
jgi:hypothetical protein